MTPKMKRLIKKCEEFYICAEYGDKDSIGVEYPGNRLTMYQYIVSGTISFNIIEGDKLIQEKFTKDNALKDVKNYLSHRVVCIAEEDSFMIGFNSLDRNIDWDGKLVKDNFTGNDKSWLVCFDGYPIINGQELKRWDYAKLENKDYKVNINDGVVGVFTKL
tara:strand:+ start:330 stop:812 length:483 start_codon:yes stop_codon:yes gene_type:complete